MGLSILELADKLRTEADAYKFLEDMRWNGQPVCPHCGGAEPYFLNPENGKTRTTTRGTESERRVWKCRTCRKQFSVLTGSIFHGTKIPVRTWVFVVFEMASSKNGVAARDIQRKYGLTAKSAWFMLHRVREAMKREPMAGLLSGRVVVDETYIDGKPKNRHRHDPREPDRQTRGPYESDKTAVVALVSRETGEVRSKVVPKVTGENLRAAIAGEVEVNRTVIHTDGSFRYPRIAHHFAGHEFVDHQAGGYVGDDITTNQAENYFSQLKRSIDGTHRHVSVPHLHRYLAEFDFRYTHRKESDTQRMGRLVRQVHGRRLSYYKPATWTYPDRYRLLGVESADPTITSDAVGRTRTRKS